MAPSISQEEISRYWEIFQQQSPSNGSLSQAQMMTVLQNSQLPASQLQQVWSLADIDGDSRMDFEEFCIAMRLVFDHLKTPSQPIPSELPQWLVPASKRHLLEAKLALGGLPPSQPSGYESPSLLDDEDYSLRSEFDWYIGPSNRKDYETIYSMNCDSRGQISFDSLNELYATLDKVPATDVSSAWNLVNPSSDEKIDKEQCIVFLHILSQRDKGVRLPRSVPASLRATFQKTLIDYNLDSAPKRLESQPSSTMSSFSEGYLSRIKGKTPAYQSPGTDFSGSKDADWEESRLKRELADLEAQLARKDEEKKTQGKLGLSSGVVRRELQMLLEYKEAQLSKSGSQASKQDLNAVREEVDMVAEQLTALKEHHIQRQNQLASLKQQLSQL